VSGDEIIVLGVCGLIAGWRWVQWARLALLGSLLDDGPARRWLVLTPLMCLLLLFAVLRAFASFDVRNSGLYTTFYMVMGAAWVGLVPLALPLMGLSLRDDVIERRNPAARVTVGAAVIAATFCFAGANIGDGPGWWVVVFCAALATVGLLALWLLLEILTQMSEAITVDRDLATSLRLAGLLIGAGLILGRAVAGDWVSAQATLHDFAAVAWPVALLAILSVVLEFLLRPSATFEPSAAWHGVPPMLLCVGVSVAYVMGLGWWA